MPSISYKLSVSDPPSSKGIIPTEGTTSQAFLGALGKSVQEGTSPRSTAGSLLFRQNKSVTSPKLSPLFLQGAQCQEPNPHPSVLAQAEPVPSPLARSLSITSAWVIQSM